MGNCANNPMFAGGCCGMTEILLGSIDNLGDDFKKMMDIQNNGEYLC